MCRSYPVCFSLQHSYAVIGKANVEADVGKAKAVYRVYIRIGKTLYYAHRHPTIDPPNKMRWETREKEYPDHFDKQTAMAIADRYCDQFPTIDKIYIDAKETSNA